MSLSSHHARIVTALALGAAVAVAVAVGGWAVFAAVCLISCAGLWEFYSMFWPGRHTPRKILGGLFGCGLLLAEFLGQPGWALGLFVAAFWTSNLAFLFRFAKDPSQSTGSEAFANSTIMVAGLMYLPLLLQFFFRFGPAEMVLVIAATLASDTGAYYAGSWCGKRKIWPAVSPKKTWMGSFGGLACCMAVCLGLGVWQGVAPWWAWCGLGVALNVAAQFGDFVESAMKRSLDVKDSGRLLPGHGGILDRIDGLLLAVPVYAAARTLSTFF
ncbi:MAG: phosphatidate cytidylyltransferase [Desulfovibrionaceae bacterium]